MKKLIFIFLFLVTFSVKGQDTAEDYFNAGAKMYVLNKKDAALQIVKDGLNKYPSDKKLKELYKKLKEDKDKNKKDKNKDKDKKDDKNKDKKDNKGDQDKNKNGDKPKDDGKPKPKPGGISKQRTENLLDAVNNEEKKVQDKVNANKVKASPVKTEKDW